MSTCDRCCARAKAQIITPSGDLLLCGHHLHQHAAALASFVVLPVSARRVADGAA